MSTRSITIVKSREKWIDRDTKKPIEKSGELMRFYRHYDGYPDGHGLQTAAAFMDAQADGIIDNRNRCAAFLGRFFNVETRIDVERPDDLEHGDIEYIYVVEGFCDYTGGREDVGDCSFARISVYRHSYDQGYADALAKEPIFSGTPKEYIAEFDKGGEEHWAYRGYANERSRILEEAGIEL